MENLAEGADAAGASGGDESWGEVEVTVTFTVEPMSEHQRSILRPKSTNTLGGLNIGLFLSMKVVF